MRTTRRSFCRRTASLGLAIAAGAARLGHARLGRAAVADDTERSGIDMITAPAQNAIDAGLKFLAQSQHEDGSFGSSGYARNVGVCGLAGMAFMSAGSTPGRGPYGGNVDRCLDFVLFHTQDSGFISVTDSTRHGPMYGHGFATLFLAEAYGMTQRPDVRDKLAKAVQLIVDTQNSEGGWRYYPQRRDADISATICQIMALRAARNAGLFVPSETVDRCVAYVKRSQNPDGGFTYMAGGGANGVSAFPRSAAGVVALYSAGIYEGPEIDKGIEYLMQSLPRGGDSNRESHYFYGHYYAVQAMWHKGGDHWQKWYPAIRDELVQRQKSDGSWIDSICAEYGAAMACIILQMPNNYLPIFQR